MTSMAHKIRPRATRKAWNPLRLTSLTMNNSGRLRQLREQMEADQAQAVRYSQLVSELQAMRKAKSYKR